MLFGPSLLPFHLMTVDYGGLSLPQCDEMI